MAIKVNGTTVINDSRALQNVASVDATTVAAMGAAGVGGETTLLVDNASVGTGSQFEVSFTTGHKYYVVTGSKIKQNRTSNFLRGRYKDSSGNAITSTSNIRNFFVGRSNGGSSYTYEDEVRFFTGDPMNANTNELDFIVKFYNPYSTTERSWGEHSIVIDQPTSNYPREINSGIHSLGMNYNSGNIVRTNAFFFYWSAGFNFTGGTYSVWGIS
jgi:hypothetical protein